MYYWLQPWHSMMGILIIHSSHRAVFLPVFCSVRCPLIKTAIINFFLGVLVDGKYIALCLAQCSRCERMQRRHTEGKMKPLTLLVASLASLCSGVPPAILCSCRHSHALNLFLKDTLLKYIIFRCIHVFNQCCYQLWYNNHDSVSAYYTLNVVSVTS